MELCRAEVVSYVECDAEEELEEPGLELGDEPGEVAVTRYTRGCTPAGKGACPSRLDEQGNRW